MKRRADWPEKLNAYIKSVRMEPFVWGKFDCCLFVADAVNAMTGEDFAASFRGQYVDAPSAYNALAAFAGGDLIPTLEKLSGVHGWNEVTAKYAQRGDILLLDNEAFKTDPRFGGLLAICLGPLCAAAAERGILFTKMDVVIRAWHVG